MEKTKPTIVVADDERAIAATLATILSHRGYDASAVYTGTPEVECSRAIRPDFIIGDIDGIEAAIRIREFLPKCRILLYSGLVAKQYLIKTAQTHHFELVAKPVDLHALFHWLRVDRKHDVRSCDWCHEQRAVSGGAYPHERVGNCWCTWCLGLSTPEELETRARLFHTFSVEVDDERSP